MNTRTLLSRLSAVAAVTLAWGAACTQQAPSNEPVKTQVDLVPENPEVFTKAARKLGLAPTGPKMAFVIHGTDKPGAMADLADRLAQKSINVRATAGVSAGGNRFGAILWVAPADVDAATRALGAQVAAHHHV